VIHCDKQEAFALFAAILFHAFVLPKTPLYIVFFGNLCYNNLTELGRADYLRISEALGLNASQFELDFLNVDIDKDCPLFIDPLLIANSNSQWSIRADRTIKSF